MSLHKYIENVVMEYEWVVFGLARYQLLILPNFSLRLYCGCGIVFISMNTLTTINWNEDVKGH